MASAPAQPHLAPPAAGCRSTPPDSVGGGPSVEAGSMASGGSMSYWDADSCMLASGSMQDARNFLLLDELPSPLDAGGAGRGAARGGLPAPALAGVPGLAGMLPLPEDDPAAGMGMAVRAGAGMQPPPPPQYRMAAQQHDQQQLQQQQQQQQQQHAAHQQAMLQQQQQQQQLAYEQQQQQQRLLLQQRQQQAAAYGRGAGYGAAAGAHAQVQLSPWQAAAGQHPQLSSQQHYQQQQQMQQQQQQQQHRFQQQQQQQYAAYYQHQSQAQAQAQAQAHHHHHQQQHQQLYSQHSQHSQHLPPQRRMMYHLVLLDSATGAPLRTATDDDAAAVARLIESDSGSSALSGAASLPRAMSFVDSAAAAAALDDAGEEVGPGAHAHAHAHAHKQARPRSGGGAKRRNAGGEPGAGAGGRGGDAAGARGAQAAARPMAEKRIGPCMHCGVDESPQWRKGPPHKSVLCNACGTRWRRTHQLGPANKPPPPKRKAAELDA